MLTLGAQCGGSAQIASIDWRCDPRAAQKSFSGRICLVDDNPLLFLFVRMYHFDVPTKGMN